MALTEVAPVVEFVGVFPPAIADVGAVIHVGNEDVFDARIGLSLGLFHGLANSDDDQNDTGGPRNKPLLVDDLHIFDVDAFVDEPLENDDGVFAERFEGGFIVEGKGRNNDAHAHLEAASGAPLGLEAVGQIPEKVADRSQNAFLLDADGGIAKARGELERINSVVIHNAVQVDVADIAFFGELGFHLEQGTIKERVGLTPAHCRAHFSGGRPDFPGKQFLVFEIDIDGSDEFFSVEESSHGYFHAIHAALQLKDLD